MESTRFASEINLIEFALKHIATWRLPIVQFWFVSPMKLHITLYYITLPNIYEPITVYTFITVRLCEVDTLQPDQSFTWVLIMGNCWIKYRSSGIGTALF